MEINEEKILIDAEHFFYSLGVTLSDLIRITGKHNSSLLQLSDIEHSKFVHLYNEVVSVGLSSEKKGKLLEELIYSLIFGGYSPLFECKKNCRTSTNEIDLLVYWSEYARLAQLHISFECFGDSFLCECKNYNQKVDVTYVGKFYSLMRVTNTKLGLLFSLDGISGRSPWSDAKGLVKKIALRDNIFILDINKSDLLQIYNRESNFFNIVYNKYVALINEIDYIKYISPHNAAQMMKE